MFVAARVQACLLYKWLGSGAKIREKGLIKDADNLEATSQHQVQSSVINMDQKFLAIEVISTRIRTGLKYLIKRRAQGKTLTWWYTVCRQDRYGTTFCSVMLRKKKISTRFKSLIETRRSEKKAISRCPHVGLGTGLMCIILNKRWKIGLTIFIVLALVAWQLP